VYDSERGVTVAISFDDTPGEEDTTYRDRQINASLMHQYRQRYFPQVEQHPLNGSSQQAVRRPTYPNVILLVAAWDSITPDAHNEPEHFTSAAGISMFNLKVSGLVDLECTNVIVVVTKSLSSWDQLDDYESKEAKDAQWTAEADIRHATILDLQHKTFPKSTDWPIVFVENGGGTLMRAEHRTLPNGELSHQNLFDAIFEVIDPPGQQRTGYDFAGMHALRVLSGGEPLALGNITSEVLVSGPTEETLLEDRDMVVSRT
jgi:hypothetical protein